MQPVCPVMRWHRRRLLARFVSVGAPALYLIPNIKGEVRGSDVVFRVPTGRSEELTALFRGRLSDDQKTLSGTWQLESPDGKREGRFSAVKS